MEAVTSDADPSLPWWHRARVERPLPLLGPPWADALKRFSVSQLRSACEKQGLTPARRAGRLELAFLLTAERFRSQAESDYQQGVPAFPSHETEYELLAELVVRHQLRHVVDLGCGPGFFAQYLMRPGAFFSDGWYLGLDNVEGALAAARARLAGEPRARFARVELGGELPAAEGVDGVLLCFVLPYLDTHTADRLLRRVARAWPNATVLVALSVSTSINGPEQAPTLEQQQRYLDGDLSALEPWDVRRLSAYARAVDDRLGIAEEHRWPGSARLVWVTKPKKHARRRSARNE